MSVLPTELLLTVAGWLPFSRFLRFRRTTWTIWKESERSFWWQQWFKHSTEREQGEIRDALVFVAHWHPECFMASLSIVDSALIPTLPLVGCYEALLGHQSTPQIDGGLTMIRSHLVGQHDVDILNLLDGIALSISQLIVQPDNHPLTTTPLTTIFNHPAGRSLVLFQLCKRLSDNLLRRLIRALWTDLEALWRATAIISDPRIGHIVQETNPDGPYEAGCHYDNMTYIMRDLCLACIQTRRLTILTEVIAPLISMIESIGPVFHYAQLYLSYNESLTHLYPSLPPKSGLFLVLLHATHAYNAGDRAQYFWADSGLMASPTTLVPSGTCWDINYALLDRIYTHYPAKETLGLLHDEFSQKEWVAKELIDRANNEGYNKWAAELKRLVDEEFGGETSSHTDQ